MIPIVCTKAKTKVRTKNKSNRSYSENTDNIIIQVLFLVSGM